MHERRRRRRKCWFTLFIFTKNLAPLNLTGKMHHFTLHTQDSFWTALWHIGPSQGGIITQMKSQWDFLQSVAFGKAYIWQLSHQHQNEDENISVVFKHYSQLWFCYELYFVVFSWKPFGVPILLRHPHCEGNSGTIHSQEVELKKNLGWNSCSGFN